MATQLNKFATQCTATSKRSGKRCKNPAVRGWNVCRMHGAGGGRPREKLVSDEWFVEDGRLHHHIVFERLSRKDKYVVGSEICTNDKNNPL